MQSVPKIVRERLRAAAPAAGHPDANVLTAFAERSLPETERAVVVEHLACCADCRDVLALALPEPEQMQTVFVPARSRWLTWPVFRWGFVTACVIAVATIGVMQLQRRQALTETAHLEGSANLQTRTAAPSTAGAPAQGKDKSLLSAHSTNASSGGYTGLPVTEQKLSPRAEQAQAPMPPPPVAGVADGQLQRGSQMPTQWRQQSAGAQSVPLLTAPAPAKTHAADLAASRMVPAAPQTVQVEASSQAQQVQTEVQTQIPSNQEAQLQAQSGQPAEHFGYGYYSKRVDKAKPPVSGQGANVGGPISADATTQQVIPAAAGGTALNGRNFAQLAELGPGRMPRWNIGSTGSLQRSLDQGKTWQDVEIRTSIAPEGGLTSFVIMPETPLAKAEIADKKDLKQPAASITFRAVTATGSDVWAGGSNGILYHSIDAGQHWTRVLPSLGGATLTGDVVSVEFSDAQRGKVATSTGEVWVTDDGGQTWQRQ